MMGQLLLGIGLSSATVAGWLAARRGGARLGASVPVLTLVCASAIALTSLLQLTVAPELLPLLMRGGPQVAPDEPWRWATSLLVQDGGWAGAAFNLVGLLAIGTVAEWRLGRLCWAAVAVLAVAAAQAAALAWQPAGAGNSILNAGLAGAVSALCLRRGLVGPPRLPALVALACFVLLLASRDLHGVAGVTGALVGLVLSLRTRPGTTGSVV